MILALLGGNEIPICADKPTIAIMLKEWAGKSQITFCNVFQSSFSQSILLFLVCKLQSISLDVADNVSHPCWLDLT